MHSVSSNAVAVSKSYSPTEQKTGGVWIDGKPIYRKTWYSATNWTDNTVIGSIPNLDTVITIKNISKYDAGSAYVVNYQNYGNDGANWSIAYVATNNNVVVQRGGGFVNSHPSLVIIEYTKTTD